MTSRLAPDPGEGYAPATMERYGGNLIHSSRDDFGPLEIVEAERVRSLHFGTPSRQSALLLPRPDALILTYTQSMMAALLMHSAPASVLLIGLGGGSFARFLLQHYPDCRIDAVELRPRVVELAHGYFRVPENDPRLNIIISEGGRFLAHGAVKYSEYDLILVDAFHGTGMASQVGETQFFSSARSRLAEHGVLAANLWANPQAMLHQTLRAINDAFSEHTLRLPVAVRGNLVALASNQPIPADYGESWALRACALERFLNLDFPDFLERLQQANAPPRRAQ